MGTCFQDRFWYVVSCCLLFQRRINKLIISSGLRIPRFIRFIEFAISITIMFRCFMGSLIFIKWDVGCWYWCLGRWQYCIWYGRCIDILSYIYFWRYCTLKTKMVYILVLPNSHPKIWFNTIVIVGSKIPASRSSKSIPTILNSCRNCGSLGTWGRRVTWPKRLTKRRRIQASVLMAAPGQWDEIG